MYTMGLRLKDALSLPVDAIDSKNMVVRVISKGNKERIVPLPKELLHELRLFWTTHRHPTWVFPNMAGTSHMCRKSLYRAFTGARDSVGLSPQITVHCLRHSFATQLLQSGVEIHTLQILLGHASVKSTMIYTHMTEAMRGDLQKIIDQTFGGLFDAGVGHEK